MSALATTPGDLWDKWSFTPPGNAHTAGVWAPEDSIAIGNFVGVHAALLYDTVNETPKLLLFRDEGVVFDIGTTTPNATALDLDGTGDPVPLPNGHEPFCSGYVAVPPSGDLLVVGGRLDHRWASHVPVTEGWASLFDPSGTTSLASWDSTTSLPWQSGRLTESGQCANPDSSLARYYPTLVVLQDGRVLVASGDFWTDCDGDSVYETSQGPEPNEHSKQKTWLIYDPSDESWEVDLDAGGFTTPWTESGGTMVSYPHLKMLPLGLFYAGNDKPILPAPAQNSHLWSPLAKWGGWNNQPPLNVGDSKNDNRLRSGCVVLTLDALTDSVSVLLVGGGPEGDRPSGSAGAEIITYYWDDGEQARVRSTGWEYTDAMNTSIGRSDGNTVLLPDGTALSIGGEETKTTQNHSVELFTPNRADPPAGTWAVMDSLGYSGRTIDRGHHSVAILLPDGRVFATGHENNINGTPVLGYDYQLFYPPYLFTSSPGWASRDTIATHPTEVAYGLPFEITVKDGDASDIDEVVLMRPGAVTHGTDVSQGRILLPHVVDPEDSARLIVSGPRDESYAPEGYYMLFVLDEGVPSEAAWVKVERGSYVIADGESRRWGSHVWLDRDFIVEAGGELEILPGTVVHADADTLVGVTIQGVFTAVGTSGAPIVFTSTQGSASGGKWKGLDFQLEGHYSTSYGYVGSVEPLSRVSHARIENADVGIRISDLIAPSLDNLEFVNTIPNGGVARDILLFQTDVVIPHGVYAPGYLAIARNPGVWDLEAPINVVASNTVGAGKNHPNASWGDTTKVDLFIDGVGVTHNAAGDDAFVWFRPKTTTDSTGDGWGGIEVHSWAKGTTLRNARVSHAVDGLFFAYAESCRVVSSQVHHFANYGIRVLGSSGTGLVVDSTLVARGSGLGATRGVWGIHAENAKALRVRNCWIYDYSYGGGWSQPSVPGGGIRVRNDSTFCISSSAPLDSVVVSGNALVGPGENWTTGERNAIQLDRACGSTYRDVAILGNGITRWFHGLRVDECRDVDVRCNYVKDARVGLEFYRATAPTSDPEVRFKWNQVEGSAVRTVLVVEGIEKLALGSPSSTTDRGLNRIVVDDGGTFYVSQFDSTDSSGLLHAESNEWYDGAAETTEAAVRAQSEPSGTSYVDQIEADNLTTVTISCRASLPDTLAPGVGEPIAGIVARGRHGQVRDGRDTASATGAPVGVEIPERSAIRGISPNPTSGGTAVRFAVGRDKPDVTITIYDVGGRRVAGLFEGRPDPGWYVVDWSGLDDGGSRVAAGVYFLRFDAGSVRETRKIVQLR